MVDVPLVNWDPRSLLFVEGGRNFEGRWPAGRSSRGGSIAPADNFERRRNDVLAPQLRQRMNQALASCLGASVSVMPQDRQ